MCDVNLYYANPHFQRRRCRTERPKCCARAKYRRVLAAMIVLHAAEMENVTMEEEMDA
jgi:hypothetical protein